MALLVLMASWIALYSRLLTAFKPSSMPDLYLSESEVAQEQNVFFVLSALRHLT